MRLPSVEAIISSTDPRTKPMASCKERQESSVSPTSMLNFAYLLGFWFLFVSLQATFSREGGTESAAISCCVTNTTILTGQN